MSILNVIFEILSDLIPYTDPVADGAPSCTYVTAVRLSHLLSDCLSVFGPRRRIHFSTC